MGRRGLLEARVRAACQATGETANAIAHKAGFRHSTLSRVLTGQTREVNPTTLRKLSTALRVPEEWLTGDRDDLPYVPEFDPQPPKGGKAAPSLWERPTLDCVRYSWFLQRVDEAVQRNLREWFGDTWGSAYQSWGRPLLSTVGLMASALVWRTRAAALGGAAAISGTDDVVTVNWLEHILEPWLNGEDYLDAHFIGRIYEALVAESLWQDEIRDGDALRVLRAYAQKEREVSQARLAAQHDGDDDGDGKPGGVEFLLLEGSDGDRRSGRERKGRRGRPVKKR